MGTSIGRVRTKRVKAPAKLAQGSQPVPVVAAAPPPVDEDDDTQVIDEAELAALLERSEKHTTREG